MLWKPKNIAGRTLVDMMQCFEHGSKDLDKLLENEKIDYYLVVIENWTQFFQSFVY